jgi:drug/metabolite transporter (DMT)-like permease
MLQIEATRVTNPATVGVVLGAAPLVIAVVGPVAAGRRPTGRVLGAAALVAGSAATAQLGGASGRDGNLLGLVLSIGALLGVAGTSLLAAPVLHRLGPLAVSTYSCALAAGLLLPVAAAEHFAAGTPVLRPPTGSEFAALVYLALAVTAVVFLAWYGAVARLGVERTGLFNGLIPVGSLIAVPLVGVGTITGAQVTGAVGVLAGITLGLTDRAAVRTQPTARNRRRQVRTAAEDVETPPGSGGAALTQPDRTYPHQLAAKVQAGPVAGRDRGPHDPAVPRSARWPTVPPPSSSRLPRSPPASYLLHLS